MGRKQGPLALRNRGGPASTLGKGSKLGTRSGDTPFLLRQNEDDLYSFWVLGVLFCFRPEPLGATLALLGPS